MRKTSLKQIFGIVILFMFGTSPLVVTYSYAVDEEYLNEDSIQGDWKIVVTEKIVNGKLEVKQYIFSKNTSALDIQKILSLEGESGWAYARHSIYQSGIVLFDGKSPNIDNMDGFSTIVLSVEKEFLDSESYKNKEIVYKVIFSGKITETNVDTNLVISIMSSGWKILQLTQNVESHSVSFQNVGHIDFSQKNEFRL